MAGLLHWVLLKEVNTPRLSALASNYSEEFLVLGSCAPCSFSLPFGKLPYCCAVICHADQPTSKFGEKLKEQVEERLHFYETGATPRKNTEVMKEAIAEAKAVLVTVAEGTPGDLASSEKKKKKKKKRSSELDDSTHVQPQDDLFAEEMETDSGAASAKKKKKKHKKSLETET